ncbi:MAG: wax ester/triacylglycerol synthase family O-acyltransferase [Anaerolineales bacterium]|nr:wax ester/triacylglycerol synthase family O-acyltransferase [Anaerolineales bacterium]
MPDYEPLSSLDAAILGIEDKTNLMVVSGILTFAQPVVMEDLKTALQRRWLTQRRMRQRLIRPNMLLARAYWEDDPHFNFNAHIHRVALPEPGDRAVLQELASDLISMPLDYSKPLWQVHVIENYGSGGAVMFRIHHTIADGVALAELLIGLTAISAAESLTGREETAVSPNGQKPEGVTEIAKQLSIATGMGRRFARRLAIAGLDVLSEPEKARGLMDKGAAYAQSALQLVLKIAEPETVFDNALGVSKRVAWSEPVPLEELQQVRRALGGTLNDIMVTALIGGLRRYMVAEDQPVNGAIFRAAIPVNLRPKKRAAALGNEFGVVFLTAPLAMADPLERLAEVRARMDQLKQSPDAVTAQGLISALAFAPPALQNALVKQMGTLATAVISNVAGPPETRYLAGQKIEEVMFWAPQSGYVGLGITIYSFAGQVYVGVSADKKLMGNPNDFVAAFHAEYAAMVHLAQSASPAES